MEVQGSVVKNEQGRVIGITGTTLDITERKQADDALRLAAAITENMAEGAAMVRCSDGILVYVTVQFARMFGYEPDELIGKHVSILNAPGDESADEMAVKITTHLKTHGVWRGDIINRKKNGTTFWCHADVTSFLHPLHGNIWVATHEDITEGKKMEQVLKQQVESLEAWNKKSREIEMRMVELKKEVNSLLERIGEPKKYKW